MSTRILFDADLTMGVPDCDVDDGLALFYALGAQVQSPGEVEIVGLTTSYGNSSLPIVHENAQRMVREFDFSFPVLKGAADKEHPASEAAEFLAHQAQAAPGTISLSVTGSTTNLLGALQIDADILSKFKEVVLMGGITQSLVFNGNIMDELNFSCDPEATYALLDAARRGARIVVMTANNCLPAYFSLDDFKKHMAPHASENSLLYEQCLPWFETMQRWYGLDGFVCWDVLTSAFILEPDAFIHDEFDVLLDKRMLSVGYLESAFSGAPSARITTPRIKNPAAFCKRCFELWKTASARKAF